MRCEHFLVGCGGVAICVAAPAPEYSQFSRPLRFEQDGTFQISIFEDLHFGESTDRAFHMFATAYAHGLTSK
jgi:hypothetical protein